MIQLKLTSWPSETVRHINLAAHFVTGYEQLFILKDGQPYSPNCAHGCYSCSNVECSLNQPVS